MFESPPFVGFCFPYYYNNTRAICCQYSPFQKLKNKGYTQQNRTEVKTADAHTRKRKYNKKHGRNNRNRPRYTFGKYLIAFVCNKRKKRFTAVELFHRQHIKKTKNKVYYHREKRFCTVKNQKQTKSKKRRRDRKQGTENRDFKLVAMRYTLGTYYQRAHRKNICPPYTVTQIPNCDNMPKLVYYRRKHNYYERHNTLQPQHQQKNRYRKNRNSQPQPRKNQKHIYCTILETSPKRLFGALYPDENTAMLASSKNSEHTANVNPTQKNSFPTSRKEDNIKNGFFINSSPLGLTKYTCPCAYNS